MLRSTRHAFAALFAASLLALVPAAAGAAQLGTRMLRSGSHGPDVVALQTALARLGYAVAADGQYGAHTSRAVRRFERAHHIYVDGRVSPREGRIIARAAERAQPPAAGGASPAATAVPTTPPPATAAAAHVFPVAGSYSFGNAADRFGAARSGHIHQGQDVLAAEGTPLVSASAGTVYWRAYQAAGAGYYIVIRGDDGFDYVYMHLREPAKVAVGTRVSAGQAIGHVGQTGDAEGPHLHFELWLGHWQAGGHPIDPLPYLESWR